MDWKDLELLLAVSRTGGAAAAATSLGISHATVSRRVSDLEMKLRVSLVDRTGQSWRITPLCAALAQQAASMEAHHDEAMRLAHAFSAELPGQVRISVPTGTVPLFCAKALKTLPLEAPEISVIFLTEDKIADLPGRGSDLAVRFTPSSDPSLIGECVAENHWGLYCSKSVAQQFAAAKVSERLPCVPLLASDPAGTFPDWAVGVFDPASPCHYVYGYLDRTALAENGFGVALLPKIAAAGKTTLIGLDCDLSAMKNELWVLANSDTRKSRRISTVKKHLILGLKEMSHLFL